MVQNISTVMILAGKKKIIIERPHTLIRIFFSIRVLAGQSTWYQTKISFDDPLFRSFYDIDGPEKYFEAVGEDIFQGDIWAMNASDTDLTYATSEILY